MKISVLVLGISIFSMANAEIRVLPELALSHKEKSQLLESALGALGEPLNEVRAFKDDVPIATLVFGPHTIKPLTFSIVLVACERGDRRIWTCGDAIEAHLAYVGSLDQSIRYHDGVSAEAAIAIHEEATSHCNMYYQDSFVFKPELMYSQDEGAYRMYGGNCNFEFKFSDGVAKIGDEFFYLE